MSNTANNSSRRNGRRRYGKSNQSANKAAEDELLYGFNDDDNWDKILPKITDGSVTKNAIILPISTRAFGLAIQQLMVELRLEMPQGVPHDFVHALYRFTLLQLELKLECAMEKQCERNIGDYGKLVRNYVSDEMKSICRQAGVCFKPLNNLIETIGFFRKDGISYIPRVAKAKRSTDGVDPTLVLITNLRRFVIALSDKNTPHDVRENFFKYNPIPAAQWTEEAMDDHPLLLNPDEIMPEEYGAEELENDLNKIMQQIAILPFGLNPSLSTENIKYYGDGKDWQLISCKIVSDWKQDSTFVRTWSREWPKLETENCVKTDYLGWIFGELPRRQAVEDYAVYCVRFKEHAKAELHSYGRNNAILDANHNFALWKLYPNIDNIPISTRGIGFLAEDISKKFTNFSLIDREENKRKLGLKIFRYTHYLLDRKLRNSIYYWPIPLSNMLALIPQTYICGVYIPEPKKTGEYAFDPCLITFSNLREYVVALASESTPAAVRKYFYDHSPLCGAIWLDENTDSPRLQNPDEIMPEDYNPRSDSTELNCMLRPNYFSDSDSDSDYENGPPYKIRKNDLFDTQQLKSIENSSDIFLSSFNLTPESCKRRKFSDIDFWSSEVLNDLPLRLGMLYRFGEIPRREAVDNFDIYAKRSLDIAKMKASTAFSFAYLMPF